MDNKGLSYKDRRRVAVHFGESCILLREREREASKVAHDTKKSSRERRVDHIDYICNEQRQNKH